MSSSKSVEALTHDGNIVIYYGSQYGRTEALANRLNYAALSRGFQPTRKDLYKFDPDEFFNETLVIFIVATFSNGGATDNAAHFNFWLQHHRDIRSFKKSRSLKGMQYAVFASGDTKYGISFNAFGIFVDEKLSELGASRILPCYHGDSNAGLDKAYSSWEEDLFRELTQTYKGSPTIHNLNISFKLPKEFTARFLVIDVPPLRAPDASKRKKESYNPSNPSAAVFFDKPNLVIDSATFSKSKSMLYVDMAMEIPPFVYTSADTIAIFPKNSMKLVQDVADLLHIDIADKWVQLIPIPGTHNLQDPFPTPAPLTRILCQFYELATVGASLATHLAFYASDPEEAARLQHLGTDSSAYEATLKGLSLAGVLRQFPSIKISLQVLLHILPLMRPRQFTIASSNMVTPTNIHLCISVPPASTFELTDRSEGFMGSFFTGKPSEADPKRTLVHSYLLPSKFRAGSLNEPMVFIANGSGFAVIRAMMLDRFASVKPATGKHLIIYGCPSNAYVPYQNELTLWQSKLKMEILFAFSSTETDGVKCRHVQDIVQEKADALIQLIDEQQGRLYVCGKKAMAVDVKNLLLKAKERQLESKGTTITPPLAAQSNEWIRNLISTGKYIESAWG